MEHYQEELKKITTFIFDFDGVLSDGTILVAPNGDQLRATNAKDNTLCEKGTMWRLFRADIQKPCA